MKYALFTALLFTVLLVGCGAPSETAAPQETTDTDEPTLREVIEEAGVEIDPVLREIMMLEEKRVNAEFTVAYTTTMSNNGETFTSQMTEFQDGAERKRTDASIPDLGESRTYTLGERYISCSKFTDSWRCTEYTGGDEEVEIEESEGSEVDTTWTDEEEVEEIVFERDGTMSIAGVTAQCYKANIAGLDSRQCYSNEGVTLFMRAVDEEGGVMEIRATSYKTSTAANDFNLPAEPMDPNSDEAQEASCQEACAMMDMSGAECDEFCAQMAAYE